MAVFQSKSVPGIGWAKPIFQLGEKTLAVPMTIHNAARKKLVTMMGQRGGSGFVLLMGGGELNQYDSDTELVFRQDSWFNYLFGVKEPGFLGVLSLESGVSTLFMPRHGIDYSVFCGTIHPPEHFKSLYDVDEVEYEDNLVAWLKSKCLELGEAAKIHVMEGQNSDSGTFIHPPVFPDVNEISGYFDTSLLYHALSTARVTKSHDELVTMRYAAYVASNAHVAIMRKIHAGLMEYELEAEFLYEIYKHGGCRKAAYTSICACGPNAATLHYGHAGAPNDRLLLPTDIALLDQGADYHGYVSDITCSYPVSGVFTSDQRAIYETVLNAQIAVMTMLRPGVSWVDCHLAAEREVVSGLLAVGVLTSGTVEEIIEAEVGAVFFPHGLGHLIGCDTHDVGGYLDGTPLRSSRPGLKKLRTARCVEANMVLTNEPGCYFIDTLLDRALATPAQARFINNDILQRFRGTGGVRLEDVICVTEDGVTNLTTCPRAIAEIESVMGGGKWPPLVDALPVLRRQWGKLAPGGLGMVDVDVAL